MDEEGIIINYSTETRENESVAEDCLNIENEEYLEPEVLCEVGTVAEKFINTESEEVLDPKALCDVEIKEGAESVSFSSTSVQNIEGVGLVQIDIDKKGFTEINYVPESGVAARNSHKFGTKFICNYCSYYSRRRNNIVRHMITVHNEVESVAEEFINKESEEVLEPPEALCDIEIKEGAESVSFSSTSVQNIEGVGLVQIDIDKKGFTEINYVPESGTASRNSHKFGTKFICNYCSYFSRRRNNIIRHMFTVHNGNEIVRINCDNNMIECDQCDEKLSSRFTYENHYSQYHSSCKKLYSCHYCKHKANRISYLKKHIFTMHLEQIYINNEAFFHCYLCKFKSTYEFLFNLHMKRHHNLGENYLCIICKRRFGSSTALKKHKSRVHTEQQIFSCNVCDFKSTSRPNLLNHVNYSHKNDMVSMITSSMFDLT